MFLDIPDLVAHNIFMSAKTKKAQVVVAAIDKTSHTFHFLLLQTNEERGSFWQNVTGRVEEDETFEEGALRETLEETGVEVSSIVEFINLGLKYNFVDQRKRDVEEEAYLLLLENKWEVKIDSSEHQGFKWIGIDDLNPDIVKHQSNFETLQKAQNLLKHWGR